MQFEPSREERLKHELAPIPYRSWCRHCVRGCGKNDAHRRMDAEASHEIPHVSMDCFFMGQDEEKCLPMLAMKDHKSKMIFSHVVPKKGASVAYCVSQAVRNLEYLGYPKIVLKCDQEPAMLDLWNAVAKACKQTGVEILPEHSPVGESQSNGVIERAIQEVEGVVRTLKDQVEEKYQQRLQQDHPFLVWLIRHAGDLWSKYQLGVDGKTPYERLKGKKFGKEMYAIGSCVHYMPLGGKG